MIPNFTDSGLTNVMKDEKLRNDYMDTRFSRLEKGLSKSQKPGVIAKLINKIFKRKR